MNFSKNFIIEDSATTEKINSDDSLDSDTDKNSDINNLVFYSKLSNNNPISLERLKKDLEIEEYSRRKNKEKIALKSIYGTSFVEVKKNEKWSIKLFLEYLIQNDSKEERKVDQVSEKKICRFYLQGHCKLGKKCKLSHEEASSSCKSKKENPHVTLEIKFSKGKYKL